MAYFAPVCPVHILKQLAAEGSMGTYHLPLAHDVLEHKDEYHNLFVKSRYADFISTTILDNSVIELGTAVDINVIGEAAKIVHANVIVLPDVLLDAEATVANCKAAIPVWREVMFNIYGSRPWSFMIVPQGKTPGEFAWCAEQFANDIDIGWWGIPRNYNIKGLGSRRDAVEIVRSINSSRKIHLLGFSDNIVDDVLSARSEHVAGIDSAVPIRAASLGMKISMGLDADLPPRGKWWNDPNTDYVPLMKENLEWFRARVRSS